MRKGLLVLTIAAATLVVLGLVVVSHWRDTLWTEVHAPPSPSASPQERDHPAHIAAPESSEAAQVGPRLERPAGPQADPVALLRQSLLADPVAGEPVEAVFGRLARTSAPPLARKLYLTLFLRKAETLPLMCAKLRSGTTEEKAEAISLLARYFSWAEAAPLVAAIARDPREPDKLRLRAIYAAHVLGHPMPAATACGILESAADSLIRELALDVLGALRDPAAAPVCQRFLDDPSPRVCMKAAKALGELGHPAGEPAAAKLLDHTNWVVRKMAADALGAAGSAAAAERLTARLGTETSPSVRAAIQVALHARALKSLSEDKQIAHLEALVGADEWVSRWALEQLFREHRPGGLPALRRLAHRSDRHGHAAAVYALVLEGGRPPTH